MKSNTNCFNCKITQNHIVLHDEDYKTLKDISTDIGLSYNIIADISSKRKVNKKYSDFKFLPKIEIKRLDKTKIIESNDKL
tara:strand:+ start:966 stop:1208 length:243 start_codon:yes stop_codon:yes gene_type:complete